MKKIVVYILTLITAFSCSPEQIPDDTDLAPIRLSVVADGVVSRAYMYDDDLTKEQEFGLNAYLIDGNNTLVSDLKLDKGKYAIFAYKDDWYHMFSIIDNIVYDKTKDCFGLYVIRF